MSDGETFDDLKKADLPGASGEPGSAKPWLALLENAKREFDLYQSRADDCDKLYADLSTLSATTAINDPVFQMFWANIQVLAPSIYSRPPVPVVGPRFKDHKPVQRIASELLERALVVTLDMEDIDSVMRASRDDLSIIARGVIWLRYDTTSGERVCIEIINRRDFLHDPARYWKEVGWVARAAWLTEDEVEKRFKKSSRGAYLNLSFEQRREQDGVKDARLKARVWEIWSKTENKVIWVADNCDAILDQGKPHLKLDNFFPCPRPAFATLQRGSLIPIPDMLYYQSQLTEINTLTKRIMALSQAVRIRAVYNGGGGELTKAIEKAFKNADDRAIFIPINIAAGASQLKDALVWLPIDVIVNAIAQLVELRKQVIQDVYEIMGLSDIMRGATDAKETLGAQELKSQFGSVRIRDKQAELIRLARDAVLIAGEIMAEKFRQETLLEMTQIDIPTRAMIAQQVQGMSVQAAGLMRQAVMSGMKDPAAMQQAQQQIAELQQQAKKIKETVTIEDVMELLRSQRLRPFILDIETDSTIAPNEQAQKQSALELMTGLGSYLTQGMPLVQQAPEFGELFIEGLRIVNSAFRVGRQMEPAIESAAEKLKAIAAKPKPPSPEQQKAQADAQIAQMKAQSEQVTAKADAEFKQAEARGKMVEAQAREQDLQAKAADEAHKAQLRQQEILHRDQEAQIKRDAIAAEQARADAKHARDMDIADAQLRKLDLEINRVQVQTDATIATTEANIDATERKTQAGVVSTEATTAATIAAKKAPKGKGAQA